MAWLSISPQWQSGDTGALKCSETGFAYLLGLLRTVFKEQVNTETHAADTGILLTGQEDLFTLSFQDQLNPINQKRLLLLKNL